MEPQGPTHIFLLSAFSTAHNTLQMVSPSKAEAADSRGKVVGLLSGLFFPPGWRGGWGRGLGQLKIWSGSSTIFEEEGGRRRDLLGHLWGQWERPGVCAEAGPRKSPNPSWIPSRSCFAGGLQGLGRKSPQHFQGWEKSTIQ